jgi:hypothetical protein
MVELRRVSSSLFQRRGQIIDEVSGILEQANADEEILMVIVTSTTSFELSSFKAGHTFEISNRSTAHNTAGFNTGDICYLFLAVDRVGNLAGELSSRSFRRIRTKPPLWRMARAS